MSISTSNDQKELNNYLGLSQQGVEPRLEVKLMLAAFTGLPLLCIE